MDALPPCDTSEPAIADFVAQLLQTTGMLMVVVGHMTRFQAAGRSSPDALPVNETLARLLCDVLSQLLPGISAGAVDDATDVLRRADELIRRDLYAVETDPVPVRSRRSGPRRTRRRR